MSGVIFLGAKSAAESYIDNELEEQTSETIGICLFALDVIALVGLVFAGALICRGKISLPNHVAHMLFMGAGIISALYTGLLVGMSGEDY